MSAKKTYWFWLIGLIVVIKIFSLFPAAVERYYSGGIYKGISAFQRILFGWIPFSMGDVFYGAVVIILIIKLVRFIKNVRKKNTGRAYWLSGLSQLLFFALSVYVVFNVLWGLNYNRVGIAKQLELDVQVYPKEDLLQVVDKLVTQLQELDTIGRINRAYVGVTQNLFQGSVESYDSLGARNKQFVYNYASVKSSMYSYLGNYLGFTGYYNPFSGEAQVNTTVPPYVLPFTTCHEIGHQLGYAKESEANFAGFLSARSSNDPAFRYSVYFDMYLYSRRYVFNLDSNLLRSYDARLGAGFKSDYKELREFWKRHENPVERLVDKVYGQYLRANQQPSGKLSYSEVISWLIAYSKKYGIDAI